MITLRPFYLIFLSFASFHLQLRFVAAAFVPDLAPVPAPSPATFPTTNNSDFIRSHCKTTLYPATCYNSLYSFASVVQQDPGRLAVVAIGVSLDKAKFVAEYLSNLSKVAEYGPEPRARAALRDCLSVFRDAVDEMRDSMNQMNTLGGSGETVRFQMSNVETWMSAALTNEDTCTDGFEDVPDGPLKTDVSQRAAKVKEVTSNALAFINSYANKISSRK